MGVPIWRGGGGRRKGCGYSNAGPEAKNSFRLSTKCSFHRGESRGSHAYLEPPCQGQALEEEGGRRGKEGDGRGGMKVMGVSQPDLDRRGAPSACGGWRESPHQYQTPIVPWLPRGPRTQLTTGQDRSLSIQAQPTVLLSLTHFQHCPFCREGAQREATEVTGKDIMGLNTQGTDQRHRGLAASKLRFFHS